jgi:tetratricopeptide (TPR) repeat protein
MSPFCQDRSLSFPPIDRAARVLVPVAAFLLFALSPQAFAQSAQPTDTLAEAQRLRAAGNLVSAARLLAAYCAAHPTNPVAARLLGETRYWMKDVAGARAAYERGVSATPTDVPLTLAYARLLGETTDRARARALLEPLRRSGSTSGQAEEMLGTFAWWDGDHVAAKRLFAAALAIDPRREEARRNLRVLLTATAPWIRVAGEAQHDDQPLDRFAGDFRAGWSPTPLISIGARAQPMRFRTEGGASHPILLGEGTVAAYVPALRIEGELAAGLTRREPDAASAWTGRGILGLRLTPRLILRARAERAPYLYTAASLSTAMMTTTVGATADWNRAGWLGQAATERKTFPDDNAVTSSYAWLLAPLAQGMGGSLQIGYSIAAQTSVETRFEPDGGPVNPRDGAPVTGQYDPYHTPVNLIAHSVIAAAMARPSARVELRANGAFGISAHDEILVYRTTGVPRPGVPSMAFGERAFNPWTVRGSLDVDVGALTHLMAEVEYYRTAFYGTGAARIGVTHRFSTPALRRLDRR